jgi:hypothetical protein
MRQESDRNGEGFESREGVRNLKRIRLIFTSQLLLKRIFAMRRKLHDNFPRFCLRDYDKFPSFPALLQTLMYKQRALLFSGKYMWIIYSVTVVTLWRQGVTAGSRACKKIGI